MSSITVVQLSKLMPKTVSSKAAVDPNFLVEYLNSAMSVQAINTKNRQAAFLANLAVESMELTRFEENLNYSAERLMEVYNNKKITRFPTIEFARSYARQPEKIANYVYANRYGNGNEASGDGWRYRGRGPIQLTFRNNYREIGKDLGFELEANPDQAKDPSLGCLIAARFFNKRGCNALADTPTIAKFEQVCRVVNGGEHGLAERIKYYKEALIILGGS